MSRYFCNRRRRQGRAQAGQRSAAWEAQHGPDGRRWRPCPHRIPTLPQLEPAGQGHAALHWAAEAFALAAGELRWAPRAREARGSPATPRNGQAAARLQVRLDVEDGEPVHAHELEDALGRRLVRAAQLIHGRHKPAVQFWRPAQPRLGGAAGACAQAGQGAGRRRRAGSQAGGPAAATLPLRAACPELCCPAQLPTSFFFPQMKPAQRTAPCRRPRAQRSPKPWRSAAASQPEASSANAGPRPPARPPAPAHPPSCRSEPLGCAERSNPGSASRPSGSSCCPPGCIISGSALGGRSPKMCGRPPPPGAAAGLSIAICGLGGGSAWRGFQGPRAQRPPPAGARRRVLARTGERFKGRRLRAHPVAARRHHARQRRAAADVHQRVVRVVRRRRRRRDRLVLVLLVQAGQRLRGQAAGALLHAGVVPVAQGVLHQQVVRVQERLCGPELQGQWRSLGPGQVREVLLLPLIGHGELEWSGDGRLRRCPGRVTRQRHLRRSETARHASRRPRSAWGCTALPAGCGGGR